jgi:hypothetical protein
MRVVDFGGTQVRLYVVIQPALKYGEAYEG